MSSVADPNSKRPVCVPDVSTLGAVGFSAWAQLFAPLLPPYEREVLMAVYAVVDPATGETVKEYPTISDDELRDAIGRADETHRTWSASSTVAERAALVRRVGELHESKRQELANIIVREMGKPVEQALGEVDFCKAIYDFYADRAATILADEPIELLEGEGSAFIRRGPVGPLLGIMPWNYPVYQIARFAAPNLATGNTIVLKHAPQCPRSAATAPRWSAAAPTGRCSGSCRGTTPTTRWPVSLPRT